MPAKPKSKPKSASALSGVEMAHFKTIAQKVATLLGNQPCTIDIAATKLGVAISVSVVLPRAMQTPITNPPHLPDFKAGLYQHYKGGYYQALGVAAHSETEEPFVVYVALDATKLGMRLRVRPLSMWNESVTDETDEGHERPRFAYVGLGVTKT